MASFAILIGPWLVATYLLARREAIGPFACVFMGLMWWLAFAAAAVLYEYVRPSPKLPTGQADPFSGFWAGFLMYGLTAVLRRACVLFLGRVADRTRWEGINT
jgi:hypothetical protein